MNGWDRLSAELAFSIFDELDHPKDLLSVSLVSNNLYRLVTPILYKNVELKGVESDYAREDHDVSRTLRRFTRTISSNPHLGVHVRSLSLLSVFDLVQPYDALQDSKQCSSVVDVESHPGREAQVAERAVGFLEECGMPQAVLDDVQADLISIARVISARNLPNGLIYRGGSRGMVLALLHHLSSLSVLVIRDCRYAETIACSCFGAIAGGVPSGLLSLSQLTLMPGSPKVSSY